MFEQDAHNHVEQRAGEDGEELRRHAVRDHGEDLAIRASASSRVGYLAVASGSWGDGRPHYSVAELDTMAHAKAWAVDYLATRLGLAGTWSVYVERDDDEEGDPLLEIEVIEGVVASLTVLSCPGGVGHMGGPATYCLGCDV